MSALRIAIFDCDGTLVDSQHLIVGAMERAFQENGLARPPASAIRHVVGLSLDRAVGDLLGGTAAPEAVQSVAVAYKRVFAELRVQGHAEPLYPGIAKAVSGLAEAQWLLGVATGKSRRGLDHVMDLHGLRQQMPFRRTADDCPGKPDPAMILEILDETGVAPHDAVMIGDTAFDMEMARRAGVWAIGVNWGYHTSGLLREAGAHKVVEAAGDLGAACAALVAIG